MTITNKCFITLLGFCLTLGVSAETAVFDEDALIGSWKMYATRPSLEVDNEDRNKELEDSPFKYLAGNDEKKNNETWTFKKDGSFELLFDDPRAASRMTSKTRFVVEGNTLKIEKLGRPGKYSRYTLHSQNDKEMILKSGVYFFYTKQ